MILFILLYRFYKWIHSLWRIFVFLQLLMLFAHKYIKCTHLQFQNVSPIDNPKPVFIKPISHASLLHLVFPSRHPSRKGPDLMLFKFGDPTWTGVSAWYDRKAWLEWTCDTIQRLFPLSKSNAKAFPDTLRRNWDLQSYPAMVVLHKKFYRPILLYACLHAIHRSE